MRAETAVFWVGLALGLAAAALAARLRGRSDEGGEGPAPPAYGWPFCIALALTVFLGSLSLFRVGHAFLQGGDEYCRANYALDWAEHPFFAPNDHIWLSGQAVILGALYRILGNMRMVVAFTSLAGYGVAIYFTMSLARRLWNSTMAGLFAGLLVGTEEMILWGAINPQSEVFFFPAVLAAMDFWLAGWIASRNAPAATRLRARADALFLLSAACVGFGNAFRYEMWYFGAALGLFLVYRFLRLLRSPDSRSRAWLPALGCLLIAAFPLAWMISSAVRLGSAFAFLENCAKSNVDTNLFYDLSSPWKAFLAYPTILWLDHWRFLALPAAGILLAWVSRRRDALVFVCALAALFLVSMLISIKGGIGSNCRARYTLFILLPLICVGTGPLAFLWNAPSTRIRRIARPAVAVFSALCALSSFYIARSTYPNAYGVDREVLEVVAGLETESGGSRPVPSHYIQIPNEHLVVYPHRDYHVFWMIRYHSRWPGKVWGLYDPRLLEDCFGWAPPKTHFLIRQPAPQIAIPPRLSRIGDVGSFDLWEAAEPPAPK
ncbi:hypothetical protein JW916_12935 [Candidatus Sumerlaeota bacterium]|nr:hypothetical protein [Candidatus Sumerlaeota bacterium]